MNGPELLKKTFDSLGVEYEETIQEQTGDEFGHLIEFKTNLNSVVYFAFEDDKVIWIECN